MNEAQKLLDLILLEKAALQRWLQELENREAVIRRWVEKDVPRIEHATTDLRFTNRCDGDA